MKGSYRDGGFKGRGDKKYGGKSSGGRNFDRGGDRGFGGRDGGRPTMHKGTCDTCGRPCEVPFRPSGDRPIFCRDCFGKKESGGSVRFERRDDERPRYDDKKKFDAVCASCGNDCQVPFRPVDGRPVYCSNCFDKNGSGGRDSRDNDRHANTPKSAPNYKHQFDLLNTKLDKIMNLLSADSKTEAVEDDWTFDTPKEEKPKKIAKSAKGESALGGKKTAKKTAVKKKK